MTLAGQTGARDTAVAACDQRPFTTPELDEEATVSSERRAADQSDTGHGAHRSDHQHRGGRRYGGGLGLLGAQLVGILAVGVFVALMSAIVWSLLKAVVT